MSTLSLRKRLLIAATFTLVAFLGLAGVALDRAFVSSAKITVKEQLKTQINALLTVVEIGDQGELIVPDTMPESRLASPNSGLYAVIMDRYGDIIWRSHSSLGISTEYFSITSPGQENFYQVTDEDDSPFYYSFGIAWEIDIGKEIELTLAILNESTHFIQVIRKHRNELIFWLGMAGLLLLLMQGISLRWGLKPLGKVVDELDRIEHARQKKILGVYPEEIAQLSERINLFIENERKNLVRYRNTLGDLAHSLKTPLAVIKGATEGREDLDKRHIGEHVDRMNKIVEYQLKRAASSQFSVMHTAVDVAQIVGKLDDTLQKVYADKNILSEKEIGEKCVFLGDDSDFYELAGNIMDNAYKWAASVVRMESRLESLQGVIHKGLVFEVHDDGPGINISERRSVLMRGARADQQTPGQGIGLAVAREIVERYNGSLSIHSSDLGGALVRIELPAS